MPYPSSPIKPYTLGSLNTPHEPIPSIHPDSADLEALAASRPIDTAATTTLQLTNASYHVPPPTKNSPSNCACKCATCGSSSRTTNPHDANTSTPTHISRGDDDEAANGPFTFVPTSPYASLLSLAPPSSASSSYGLLREAGEFRRWDGAVPPCSTHSRATVYDMTPPISIQCRPHPTGRAKGKGKNVVRNLISRVVHGARWGGDGAGASAVLQTPASKQEIASLASAHRRRASRVSTTLSSESYWEVVAPSSTTTTTTTTTSRGRKSRRIAAVDSHGSSVSHLSVLVMSPTTAVISPRVVSAMVQLGEMDRIQLKTPLARLRAILAPFQEKTLDVEEYRRALRHIQLAAGLLLSFMVNLLIDCFKIDAREKATLCKALSEVTHSANMLWNGVDPNDTMEVDDPRESALDVEAYDKALLMLSDLRTAVINLLICLKHAEKPDCRCGGSIECLCDLPISGGNEGKGEESKTDSAGDAVHSTGEDPVENSTFYDSDSSSNECGLDGVTWYGVEQFV